MLQLIRNFKKDESGATAIEYGLIAALVAVGLILVLGALQGSLTGIFNQIVTALGGTAV